MMATMQLREDWGWEHELVRSPDWREQLIAEVEGSPIGFIQIIDPAREDSHYWGDCPTGLRAIDIWIGEEAFLGRGLGTEMMRLAIDRCFADPTVGGILIDPMASRSFGDDDCAVYRLERGDWQA